MIFGDEIDLDLTTKSTQARKKLGYNFTSDPRKVYAKLKLKLIPKKAPKKVAAISKGQLYQGLIL